MSKKILITGHRGWIGSNLVRLLDQNGIAWIGLDKKDGQDLGRDMSPILSKLDEFDTIVHLAATPRIPASWLMADHYRNNNVGVTDMIANLCAAKNKYLIFASSSSVYGNGNGPLNPYSWTKLAGEQSIEMYGRSRGLVYTILRFFTNYGEDDPSGLVIGRWIDNERQGQPLMLRGTGEQSRDFVHVSDTAQAILTTILTRPYNKTLDIGTGNSYKLIDLAQHFTVPVLVEPELEGYAASTRADIVETQKHIQWNPKIELVTWLKSQLMK
jgi:nucleoside-diphosphate-sugar epimerase